MMRGHHSPSRLPTAFSQRSTGSITWESAEMIRRSWVAMTTPFTACTTGRRGRYYRSGECGEEAHHGVGGGGGLLEAIEVAAALDDLHVGARDGLGQILGVLESVPRVGVAHDDERGTGDLPESAADLGALSVRGHCLRVPLRPVAEQQVAGELLGARIRAAHYRAQRSGRELERLVDDGLDRLARLSEPEALRETAAITEGQPRAGRPED